MTDNAGPPRTFFFEGHTWHAHEGEKYKTIKWSDRGVGNCSEGRVIHVTGEDGKEIELLTDQDRTLSGFSDADLVELMLRRREELDRATKGALEAMRRYEESRPAAEQRYKKLSRVAELIRTACYILRGDTAYAREAFASAKWLGDFKPRSFETEEIAGILDEALTRSDNLASEELLEEVRSRLTVAHRSYLTQLARGLANSAEKGRADERSSGEATALYLVTLLQDLEPDQ